MKKSDITAASTLLRVSKSKTIHLFRERALRALFNIDAPDFFIVSGLGKEKKIMPRK